MNQWMRLLALLMTFCLLLPVAVAEEAEVELSLSVSQAELSAGQSVTITCELPHDGRMCLHVLDAEGQEAATLIAETDVQAGETAYVWDGTADGEMVPAGVYYLVLTLDENSAEMEITVQGSADATAASFVNLNKTITPAYLSDYHPNHENCYWCTRIIHGR